MDGVLVDTGDFHFQAWHEILLDYGIEFSYELHQETFGTNNASILSLLLGEKLTPELLFEISALKEERFRAAIRGHARPLPGVQIWLERLRKGGARQGIGSSAPMDNIDALLGELGLRGYFDAIVSGEELPAKPDPTLFLEVARQLGIPSGGCVVVEDAVAGVEAAKRAGMNCIAVTTTNQAQALSAADVVVDRLDALPPDAFQRLVTG